VDQRAVYLYAVYTVIEKKITVITAVCVQHVEAKYISLDLP
jgi:hypothetical protein